MWGWLEAIVKGIVQPVVESQQQKQHGRVEQQRDDLQATLDTERKIADALAADDPGVRDRRLRDLLRRQRDSRQAPPDGGPAQ